MELPTGTLTFLLTDVEESTRLWEEHPKQMREALPRHDSLAANVVERHDGTLVKSRGEGDSLFAVFSRATNAVAAAVALQRDLLAQDWPAPVHVRVRMALHSGEADLREGDYFGATINRCARVRAAGHGGQILLTSLTYGLVQDLLAEGMDAKDLGTYYFRGLQRAEQVFQALHPDLSREFPALRGAKPVPGSGSAPAGSDGLDLDQLLAVLVSMRNGDFGARMPADRSGIAREIAATLNDSLDTYEAIVYNTTGTLRALGYFGRLGVRVSVPGASGRWKDLLDAVNLLYGNLTVQLREVARATAALMNGDFTQKVAADAQGEIGQLKYDLNRIQDQLAGLALEVTRITREIGTEGRFGGQAEIPELFGAWRDMRENLNIMAGNLTDQVRSVSRVVWRVGEGDLTARAHAAAEGEMLELSRVVNSLIDRLRVITAEIKRVCREIRRGERLDIRADVPEASGVWRELVTDLNALAAHISAYCAEEPRPASG